MLAQQEKDEAKETIAPAAPRLLTHPFVRVKGGGGGGGEQPSGGGGNLRGRAVSVSAEF